MKLTKAQRDVLTRMANEPLIIVPPVGKQWSEPTRFAFRGKDGMGLNSHYINSRVVYKLKEKGCLTTRESICFLFFALTEVGRKALETL